MVDKERESWQTFLEKKEALVRYNTQVHSELHKEGRWASYGMHPMEMLRFKPATFVSSSSSSTSTNKQEFLNELHRLVEFDRSSLSSSSSNSNRAPYVIRYDRIHMPSYSLFYNKDGVPSLQSHRK
jgi:hypothetical protein